MGVIPWWLPSRIEIQAVIGLWITCVWVDCIERCCGDDDAIRQHDVVTVDVHRKDLVVMVTVLAHDWTEFLRPMHTALMAHHDVPSVHHPLALDLHPVPRQATMMPASRSHVGLGLAALRSHRTMHHQIVDACSLWVSWSVQSRANSLSGLELGFNPVGPRRVSSAFGTLLQPEPESCKVLRSGDDGQRD
jgi:hypothetical protein